MNNMVRAIVKQLSPVEGLEGVEQMVCSENELLNGVTANSQVKDKKLKNTKSWSTNLLVRLHFLLKKAGKTAESKQSP